MSTIICISYLLLLLVIKLKIKDRISKLLIIVYVTYWCASLFLCNLNLYDYYNVSNDTYLLLLGHTAFFLIGFALIQPRYKCDVSIFNKININKTFNNLFFLLIFSFCFIYMLILLNKVKYLLLLYTASDLRGDFSELILEGNALASLFMSTFVASLYHFSLALMTYMLFFDRRWKYIIVCFLYAVCYSTLSGGRAQFMTFGFYAISMFFVLTHINSINKGYVCNYVFTKKMKLIFLIGFAFITTMMVILTIYRAGNDRIDKEHFSEALVDLGEKLGAYSAGPIVAFDIALQNENSFFKEKYYGLATFARTSRILSLLLRRVGIHVPDAHKETTMELQNNRIFIGTNKSWNYAYTSCYYYYHDFGVIGLFIFPFILGLIARRIVGRLYKHCSIYDLSLFFFICHIMYMSVFSGYLQKDLTYFYIIILLFLSNISWKRSRVII